MNTRIYVVVRDGDLSDLQVFSSAKAATNEVEKQDAGFPLEGFGWQSFSPVSAPVIDGIGDIYRYKGTHHDWLVICKLVEFQINLFPANKE